MSGYSGKSVRRSRAFPCASRPRRSPGRSALSLTGSGQLGAGQYTRDARDSPRPSGRSLRPHARRLLPVRRKRANGQISITCSSPRWVRNTRGSRRDDEWPFSTGEARLPDNCMSGNVPDGGSQSGADRSMRPWVSQEHRFQSALDPEIRYITACPRRKRSSSTRKIDWPT